VIRALLAAAAAVLLAWAPCVAEAWTPLESCGGGSYTAWPGNHAEWRYASNFPSGDFSEAEAIQIITDSFEEWGEPGCSGFTSSRGSDTGGDPMWGNANLAVGFYGSNWPGSLGAGVLAVTFPSWDWNCNLVSASIAMNEQSHNWSSGGGGTDAQSVMTHEVGHYVGLDHSSYWDSSMTPSYSGGIGDRTLSCDDTEAACALYPVAGTACGAPAGDDYCPCGQTCQGGWCNGVVSGDPWGGGGDDDDWGDDDDDDWGDDDDDDGWDPPNGGCTGPPESYTEAEPNDWDNEGEFDNIVGSGGDVTISSEIWCLNNGSDWLGDVDWFVLDFPCADEARFTVNWSGGSSDLDFWVYDENTNPLAANMDEDYSGPVTVQAQASNRVYIAVACWTGPPVSYTVEVDFSPWGWDPADDGDDDDDGGPGNEGDDDDTDGDGDDDGDPAPGDGGDDDDADSGDDDGGGPEVSAENPLAGPENLANAGCGCAASVGTGAEPAPAGWLALLGLVPVMIRRRRTGGLLRFG
jgi:hypothetical protein